MVIAIFSPPATSYSSCVLRHPDTYRKPIAQDVQHLFSVTSFSGPGLSIIIGFVQLYTMATVITSVLFGILIT